MNNLTAPEIITKLRSYLAERPYIAFGYLFGSRTGKNFTPLSDIDLAVFIDTEKISEDLFELRLKELTALFRSLETDHLDLVFLNETPIDLSYNIIKHGLLIEDRDSHQRIQFVENTVRNYLDRKYFLDYRNKIIRQKMIEGSYFD